MGLFRNPNEANYQGGKKHILESLKNTSPANVLIWKQPEEDFNTHSVLTVNPGEEAVFVKNGEVVSVFQNGRYVLKTENYVFLSRLRNMLSGGISTFNCFVYFVRKASTMELLWGTNSPIQLRDPVQGIATSIKARGSYKIHIDDSIKVITTLLGSNISRCAVHDAVTALPEGGFGLIDLRLKSSAEIDILDVGDISHNGRAFGFEVGITHDDFHQCNLLGKPVHSLH